jgi:hypothetical protein
VRALQTKGSGRRITVGEDKTYDTSYLVRIPKLIAAGACPKTPNRTRKIQQNN